MGASHEYGTRFVGVDSWVNLTSPNFTKVGNYRKYLPEIDSKTNMEGNW